MYNKNTSNLQPLARKIKDNIKDYSTKEKNLDENKFLLSYS